MLGIRDLMQGFTVSQVIKNMVYISIQYFFYYIVIISDLYYHNMVKKILYTYVNHVVDYLGNCKALHKITDLEHLMLSVCAPLGTVHANPSFMNRGLFCMYLYIK